MSEQDDSDEEYDFNKNPNNYYKKKALEKKNPRDKEKDKERDRIKSRREEPTGEAQSLIGRKLHKFGDLAQREKIPQNYLYRRKNEEQLFRLKNQNIKEGYNPKTKDTKSIYEDIIVMVQKYLCDQPPEYVNSAVNEIIPNMKKSDLSQEDKKIYLKNILGKEIKNEEINKIILLCKGLLDYTDETNEIENEKNNKKYIGQEMDINMNLDIDDDAPKEGDVQPATYLEIEEIEKSDTEELNDKMELENKKEGIKSGKGELSLDAIINDIGNLKEYLKKVLDIKEEKDLKETENILYGYLNIENQNECENNLFMMLGNENINLIQFLLSYKNIIIFLYSIQKANTSEEKTKLINNLKHNSKESYDLLNKKHFFDSDNKDNKSISTQAKTVKTINERNRDSNNIILSNIDLSKFDFIEEDPYMRSKS